MARVTQLIETKQPPPESSTVTYMPPHWAVNATHQQALSALATLGDNQSH